MYRLSTARACFLFMTGFAVLSPSAWAIDLPSAAEPDRLGNTIVEGLPSRLPELLAPQSNANPPLLERPTNASQLKLTLAEIKIEGNSVYSLPALQPYWSELLGQEVSLNQIYDIADAITQHYWDQGYILARANIPQQEIGNGVVRLVIEEGRIGQVHFDGTPAPATAYAIEQISRNKVLNVLELERQLLLLNDMSGQHYRSVLSSTPEGLVDINLQRNPDSRVNSMVSFDNHGSRYVGPYLVTLNTQLQDLLAEFHKTSLTVAGATQLSEVRLVSLSHQLPLWRPDLHLTLDASLIKGAPGYRLTSNEIDSSTQQFGAELGWTWLRQRNLSVELTAGLSAYNGNVDIFGSPLSADKIRTFSLGTTAQWTDRTGGSQILTATLMKGLGGLWDGSQSDSTKLSRSDGRTDFTALKASLSRYTPLGGDYVLLTTAAGQIATSGLLAPLEFGYGGADIGRAYDTSEVTGDSGLSLLAELQLPTRPLGKRFSFLPFIFADYGAVWNRDHSQNGLTRAASAGAGLRLQSDTGIRAELLLAQPLRQSSGSTYPNSGGPRLLFSVSAKF